MTKSTAPSPVVLLGWMTLIVFLTLACAGCRTKVIVIPADKTVTYLPAGQAYTNPSSPVYIVPQARMQEILDKLPAE